MSLFDDETGDDQLDLVLKEAARLAAQMRSVSSGSKADHGVDEHMDEYEHNHVVDEQLEQMEQIEQIEQIEQALNDTWDTEPEGHSNNSLELYIPDQTEQEEHASEALVGTTSPRNLFERASLQTSQASSPSAGRDIDAAIRASEDMARALQALGVIETGFTGKSPLSFQVVESKGTASDAISVGARSFREVDDSGPSALDNDSFYSSGGRKVWDADLESSPLHQQTTLVFEKPDPSAKADSKVSPAPPSDDDDDDDASDDNESSTPWNRFLDGVTGDPAIRGHLDGATTHSTSSSMAHQSTDAHLLESLTDLADGGKVSKSQELRERLRQTEAEYAMMKVRTSPTEQLEHVTNENDAPDWLKVATLSTPGRSTAGVSDLTFDIMDAPKGGDDDYVPLKDYCSMPGKREKAPQPETKSSKSELNWTRLEQPNLDDDDFVPLRGHQREPEKPKAPPDELRRSDDDVRGSKLINTPNNDDDNVPVKDYSRSAARKLRTPSNVTWEKVDFANQEDDDYVPLKDYSKPSPKSSFSPVVKDLSPSFLHFADEDDFDIVMATSRISNFEKEGPTALAMNRTSSKKRKKMIRSVKAAVAFLVVIVAAYGYYAATYRTNPNAIKRPLYKTKNSYRSNRLLPSTSYMSQSSHLSQSQARTRKEQAAQPQVHSHVTRASRDAHGLHGKEKIFDQSKNGRVNTEIKSNDQKNAAKSSKQHLSSEKLKDQYGFRTRELAAEPVQQDEASQDNGIAVYTGIDPGASICYMPFGYLLAERCHEAKRRKRLDNLLQSMFE